MRTTAIDAQQLPWKLLGQTHKGGADDHLFAERSMRPPRSRSLSGTATIRSKPLREGQSPLIVAAPSRSLRASASLGTMPDNMESALGHKGGTQRLGRREKPGAASSPGD